ncbi:MAG: hypothetical protein K9N21_07985 [Deltaproteobacteria bacterium]|nr:hypothetical protein [Deltaproteobacteria bacterium]
MVLPEGCVKICCFAGRNIMQEGEPMSLYSSSIKDIWNSSHLRSIRHSMVKGEAVLECAHCYQEEADTGSSHRIHSNFRWKSELGPLFDALVNESRLRAFSVSTLPVYLQLIPGNLCNLKCRICFPRFSSQIESDPVHRSWALGAYKTGSPVEGTRGKARVVSGIDGFRRVVQGMRIARRLISGLNSNFFNQHHWRTTKGDPGYGKGSPENGKGHREYGIFEPESVGNGSPSRLPRKPWFKDRSWVFEELLREPERFRALYLTGGEPMIQMEAEEIIGYLVQQKASPEMTLELNTNCTVVKDALVDKFHSFKRIYMGMSIDAYGDFYEYIRYPAKWHVIRKNIVRLISLPADKFTVTAVPILQAYNVLNIVDLLRYLDKKGVSYGIEVASEPWFISLGVLPPSVRLRAARRLRAYANSDCPGFRRSHVLSVADVIESVQDNCTRESLQALMLFTNDLDATRGQSFREVHPELLGMIEEEGFNWSEERHFFPSV